MKKSQPLLKLMPVILLRVLSKWHQRVSSIQFSASFVSNSTFSCALSFSLGKNHIGLSSDLYHFPIPSEVISFLGQHTGNNCNATHNYSEVHIFLNKPVGNELLIQTESVTWDHGLAQKNHFLTVVLVIFLCLIILLIFCLSPTLRHYLPFNLVMAGYMFGNGFPASFLKQLGCLQALEQK